MSDDSRDAQEEMSPAPPGNADEGASPKEPENQEGGAARPGRDLTAQDPEVVRLREEVAGLRDQTSLAVAKYREALLLAHGDVPQELVSGTTVEEVETSLVIARRVVASIRERIETQTGALRVPAGAPVRGGPDFTLLSPQQKIVLGLRQRAS